MPSPRPCSSPCFSCRKRSTTESAAATPNELDDLNEAGLPQAPPGEANDAAGTDVESYSPLAQAVANAEGFEFPKALIPTLANNPGDLELGDVGYGVMQASGGNRITVFASASLLGWAALENQDFEKIFSGRSKPYSPR